MGCDYYANVSGVLEVEVRIEGKGHRFRRKTLRLDVRDGDRIYLEVSGDVIER